jgi:hypothetical protein
MLDLADVKDGQLAVDRIGGVGGVAVIAERQTVHELVAVPDRLGMLRVGHVDRCDALGLRRSVIVTRVGGFTLV